jgi:hypothetical protein
MWGQSGKLDVLWSRVCMKGEGTVNGVRIKGDRCGTSDPQVRFTYLFYGAPAMDLAEFKVTPVSRVIGASLAVSPPLGDYNNENLINTGANRWTFKPEIGISNRRGDWSLEASFGARLFGDNDSFAAIPNWSRTPSISSRDTLSTTCCRGAGCPLTATISGADKRKRTVPKAMTGRKIRGWA